LLRVTVAESVLLISRAVLCQ